MAKEQIKQQIKRTKGKDCAITNQPLPENFSLFDTHRSNAKKDGGTYTNENTNLAIPTAHMTEHRNYRERSEELNQLKTMIDDRSQIMKLTNKIRNQLLAYERGTDSPRQETVDFLNTQLTSVKKELTSHDRMITKYIKSMNDPLAQAALSIKAVGPITVAYCLAYIDLTKARHASSLWSYVGLHTSSHERYQKGTSSGGNKTLRTMLFTMAESQVKLHGPYRAVYDNAKARKEQSSQIVKTRNTQGNMIECAWKDTKPSHRHGHALRMVTKHFLADYWLAGRTLHGLPTSALYPEAILGSTHRTIIPEERGWKY